MCFYSSLLLRTMRGMKVRDLYFLRRVCDKNRLKLASAPITKTRSQFGRCRTSMRGAEAREIRYKSTHGLTTIADKITSLKLASL